MNLPPVIGSAVQLAPLIVPVVPEEKSSENKRYIFCISKDLSSDDKENLRDNGRVLFYNHDLMNNMSPESFDFEYLIVDMRNKSDRYFYIKEIKPIEDKFHVILYCHKFEIDDLSNIDHFDNVLCKLPVKQARKVDFNNLLLVQRLPAPSCFFSLAKYIFRAYNSGK